MYLGLFYRQTRKNALYFSENCFIIKMFADKELSKQVVDCLIVFFGLCESKFNCNMS